MAIQQEIGDKGEQITVNYLQNNGYEIVSRNYRFKKAEIDVICKKVDQLVFVEVKTRTSTKYGQPEEFVTEAKALKIMEGAEAYMVEKKWGGPIRFDIVSVVLSRGEYEVSHFKDAF